MEKLSAEGFSIEDWHVSPNEGVLSRANDTVRLEPKVMEVLVYLASRPGEVVTREDLERDVWKGALVGYDAVTATVIKLRKALGDDAKQPRIIATIPKKGYQLIAGVTRVTNPLPTYAGSDQESDEPLRTREHEPLRTRDRSVSTQVIAAVVGLIVIVAGWQLLDTSPQPQREASSKEAENESSASSSSDSIPSIVVLPFKNLSDDPQQEYFSDGITDDIITDLSQVGALRVVARQSAYYYKDKSVNLSEVAKDLKVQYIVEGSVQKANQRLRINIQLTDAEKGHHLWAERFDRKLDDIFAIQDEITKRIIDAMFVTLSNQETQRVLYRTTNNFEAYDAVLLGLQHSKNRTKQGHDLAIEAYQHAIELDPNYARAYGAMAVALTRGYRFQWTTTSIAEAREHSLQLAKKAVTLDQSTPQIYWSLGFVHLFRKEYQLAETAAMQSITLSPNYADGFGLLAFIANWRGKAKEAERYIKKAITLNPYHTFDYPWNLGLAYFGQGRYEESVEALRNTLDRNETVLNPRLFLAASYVRLGQLEDAQWEIEQIGILRPDTTITHLSNTTPFENKKQLDDFLGDLKKAGLPE